MTRAVALPFLRAKPSSVLCDPWQSLIGGEAGPLPAVLPHWDYNVDLHLVRVVTIKEAALRRECELAISDPICVATTWASSGTFVRGSSKPIPLGSATDPRQITMRLDIPGRFLAGDVHVSTQVVLAAERAPSSNVSAKYPGSVLWEDEVVVALEGSSSRFPIEVVDFNTASWTPYGGAAWFLSWNRDDLHEPFLRSVRLFINSAHPAAVAAVQATIPTQEQALVRSAIYYDVGRQLIRGALENDEFVDAPESFASGSTGAAVLGMLKLWFPADKPRTLRSTLRSRPDYFDSLLQGTLRLFNPLN